MILVDTSIWIPFFRAETDIVRLLKGELDRQEIVAAECVFGELLQGAKARRERQIIAAYWQNLPKRDENGLWIEAGRLSSQERLFAKGVGLIDAFLIAYARQHRTTIWSLDRKLLAVLNPRETYFPTH